MTDRFEDPTGRQLISAERAPEVIAVLHALLRSPAVQEKPFLPELVTPIQPYKPIGALASSTEVALPPTE